MINSTDGSIRYSDLIIPDDAINNLIAQLELLGKTYDGLVKDIQTLARQMEQATGMSADEAASLAETEAGQAQNYEWIAKQTKSLTPAVILSVLALAGILCGIFINGLIFILAAPFAALAVWKFASYSESRSAAAEAASN